MTASTAAGEPREIVAIKQIRVRSGGPRTIAERLADLCAEHRVPKSFGVAAARLLDEAHQEAYRRGLADGGAG